MINDIIIQHKFEGNVCHLKIPLKDENAGNSANALAKRVENTRNCDVFVEDFTFLMFIDVQQYKFRSMRQFDLKDTKNLVIKFNTKLRCYELQLPCMPAPLASCEAEDGNHTEKSTLELKSLKSLTSRAGGDKERPLNLWKLKRITEHCQLQIDDSPNLLHFDTNFGYGFASQFRGKICCGESELSIICRVTQPHLHSPLQRSIDREIDELKNFSREQYKLNFVELQVPEGHENPMKFTINFEDNKLSQEEECLLHNYLRKSDDLHLPGNFDQNEVDCGLLSILLAICYDVRSTCNDASCESAWTRSILCPLLTYFEPCDSIKDVVISFLRRSLIYPLYRNYDFGRQCVQDAIEALQKSPTWITKQLLLTHELFATSNDSSREVFNRYYLADYIRYVNNDAHCTVGHLQMLARNLKNVLLDVFKKHLRLELGEIETELLKELITDIHIANSASEESEDDDDDEDDDEDDDDGTESGEDETETSSASETEENSVIEKRLDAMKI